MGQRIWPGGSSTTAPPSVAFVVTPDATPAPLSGPARAHGVTAVSGSVSSDASISSPLQESIESISISGFIKYDRMTADSISLSLILDTGASHHVTGNRLV